MNSVLLDCLFDILIKFVGVLNYLIEWKKYFMGQFKFLHCNSFINLLNPFPIFFQFYKYIYLHLKKITRPMVIQKKDSLLSSTAPPQPLPTLPASQNYHDLTFFKYL
jgi:hypothetical protein